MMQFGVVSLMPEMFNSLHYGITGRAIKQKIIQIDCWNPREWASLPHRQVDDKPSGGGPGMVMMYEPLSQAIGHAQTKMPADCKKVFLSPQGRTPSQSELLQIAKNKQSILFIAGRYEGVDERILNHYVDEEWSLGDFVISGGELAAMVYVDAITRLIPGALGHEASAEQDSFTEGLLDHPHYTRPAEIEGNKVPDVLLSGDHKKVEKWRRKQALGATWKKRPDLLEQVKLSKTDDKLLNEFKIEHGGSSD